jgi:hypothetical protein
VSKPALTALLAALTAAGLVLLVLGTWFTVHLGVSGTASFRTTARDGVVVLEPSVLNRVDGAVTVAARGTHGQQLFLGVATPADADAIVGGAQRTSVTGLRVRDWSLATSQAGSGSAPHLGAADIASADIWRAVGRGTGTVRLSVSQTAAPESVVVTGEGGGSAELSSLTVTLHRPAWFVESLLVAVVGLLALVAGAFGLWRDHSLTSRKEP